MERVDGPNMPMVLTGMHMKMVPEPPSSPPPSHWSFEPDDGELDVGESDEEDDGELDIGESDEEDERGREDTPAPGCAPLPEMKGFQHVRLPDGQIAWLAPPSLGEPCPPPPETPPPAALDDVPPPPPGAPPAPPAPTTPRKTLRTSRSLRLLPAPISVTITPVVHVTIPTCLELIRTPACI